MKFGLIRFLPPQVWSAAAVVYCYGALLSAFMLGWSWLIRHEAPDLPWWQWVLAPLLVGLTALTLEGVGTFLSNGFSLSSSPSRGRRIAGGAALFIALVLLVVGWPMYQLSRG